MADARNEPVLDISTIGLGAPVRIDGKRYFIRHPNKLTLESTLELERLTPLAGMLLRRARALSSAEKTELSALLDRICRLVLDAPAAVHKGLSDNNRVALLQVFINLRTPAARRTGGARGAKSRSTGARSSRDSRGSTAGPLTGGTAASRSDS